MATLQTPSRVFAALYDRLNAGPEAAGVAALRKGLLADAHGATLEIGAGTGLNLAHYTDAVDRLVLAEPDARMRERLQLKLGAASIGPPVEVVPDVADRLCFGDATFDTVVCTLVLCTVPDPAQALAEVHRVLKPVGLLLYLEHVRSERPRTARVQDFVEPLYKAVGRGCHPNRDTLASIRAAGFAIEAHRREIAPKTPATENELLIGSARSRAGA